MSDDKLQESVLEPLQKFFNDSYKLVQQCAKPDAQEYRRIAIVTGMGFAALGVLGYAVKLIHIPINNLLVGGA